MDLQKAKRLNEYSKFSEKISPDQIFLPVNFSKV